MLNTTEIQKILIIQVSRIGDTLFATPAIRTIAERCPNATITVLAHPNRASVLEYLPFIKHLGVIEKNRALFKGWFLPKQYDLAFVYGFDQPLVSYALRVSRKVVAFRQDSEVINKKLYKVAERPNFHSEHAVKQLLRLPKALGWDTTNLRLAMHITLSEFKQAYIRLDKISSNNPAPFIIGLQVASFPTKSYRDWPIESFVELAKQIKQKIPTAHFLIYGGKAERDRTEWLHSQILDYSTHLAGELSLRQTAAVMGLSNLYIGIDTGPTHMMSTFSVPMVVLFHYKCPPNIYRPLNHPACEIIELTEPTDVRESESDMSEISVKEVLLRVKALINKTYPVFKLDI